jgi:hypothetical protein
VLQNVGLSLEQVRTDIQQLLQGTRTATPDTDDTDPTHSPVSSPEHDLSRTVHIIASGHDSGPPTSSEGLAHWLLANTDLKAAVARAFGVEESQVEMTEFPRDDRRYDIVLSLAAPESAEAIRHLVQTAISTRFGVTVTRRDDGTVAVRRGE